MSYAPVTPFRRPLTAAILQQHSAAQAAESTLSVDKWDVLRTLARARTAFGLSDRDLTVLQALVSFHKSSTLGGDDEPPVVHPSNRAICERLNGMPCSTMRRHLAHLVDAGMVRRRDSPNGKRYVRRFAGERMAFGFDLTPLVTRCEEIRAAAEACRVAAERLQRLRATVSLMRRDLAGLVDYGRTLDPDLGAWDQLSDLAILTARDLRRKLDYAALEALEDVLQEALERARGLVAPLASNDLSTNDTPNEQHIQNSKIDSYESEARSEKQERTHSPAHLSQTGTEQTPASSPPNISLRLVLMACQAYRAYSDCPTRHWNDLVQSADKIRPFLGISEDVWRSAMRHMGAAQASVVLLTMLERFEEIKSPGAYLRTLTLKAQSGTFSCAPMVMALLRKEAA